MTESTGPEITRRTLTYSLALSLLGWLIFIHVVQPLPSFGYPDPQMAYFVDALNPFQGETYGFIDHPGTPISIVSTGILGITYPFIGGTANHFITVHLQNPEIFLTITHAVMMAIAIISLLQISRASLRIDHWTDGAAAAALSGFFFVPHPESLIQINQLSHNSLNFPLGAVLSLWLLNLLRNQQGVRKKHLILISTAAGILSAAQLYFAAWVVGIAVAVSLVSITERKKSALSWAGYRSSLDQQLQALFSARCQLSTNIKSSSNGLPAFSPIRDITEAEHRASQRRNKFSAISFIYPSNTRRFS